MTPLHAFSFWAFLFVAFVAIVWALGNVLAPFIVGIALAYLLDPVADRLETGGLSRRGAAVFILGVFLLVLLVLLAFVGPVVFEEVSHFLENLPRLANKAQNALAPYAQWLHERIGTPRSENLTQTLTDQVGGAVSASGGGLIAGIQAGGLA
ncbi:MAG TPA: AI-2E family transporter, partial [Alphaproteobacteria bacterium]|nr:AI-2E family transporter [Alphaproteobacteria bacterium]